MATTWKEIRGRRENEPGVRGGIARERDLIHAELRLAALRKHRGVSQRTLAQKLAVSQPNVSQIERSKDIRVSTLDSYVSALGGRLEVRAVFNDETVAIP
jgi:DNA-binding Xre family transcriptional regulator